MAALVTEVGNGLTGKQITDMEPCMPCSRYRRAPVLWFSGDQVLNCTMGRDGIVWTELWLMRRLVTGQSAESKCLLSAQP